MTTTAEGYTPQDWTGRLSPSDVHHVLFARAKLGRRGYDELEVDGFLERVQQELTRLISEKADLRDEVARLKSQLTQAQATAAAQAQAGTGAQVAPSAPTADGALSSEEANLQAVRLLAAAQQTADVYVADAEKYAQRLTVDAREHSEQMLEEARRGAKKVLAEAERAARDAASRTIEGEVVSETALSKEELDQQVAYLKTFGDVVRVQLRAYLEALLRDVEEEWGRADPNAAQSVGGPSGSSGRAPVPRPATALAAGPESPEAAPEATQEGGGETPRPDASANGGRTTRRPRPSTTVTLP